MALNFSKPKAVEAPEPEESAPLYAWPSPVKPSAVLVPTVVREHRRAARVRKSVLGVCVAAVTVSVLAAGGTWWWAAGSVAERERAEASLAAAEASVAKYAPVAIYYDDLATRKDAFAAELAGDIAFSEMYRTVLTAKPRDVAFSAVNVVPGQPCPGPDPFAPVAALGCVQISGSAPNPAAIGGLVDALNELPEDSGLSSAFAESLSSLGGAGLNFSVSVNYTPEVLTYEYVPEVAAPATTDSTDSGATATQGATQ